MSKNYLSIYAKSFNWAGFFLPKETYNDCSLLYDFCRTVDNIADNEDNLEHKKNKLYKYKKMFYEKDFSSKEIKSMWGLIDKFSIHFGRSLKLLVFGFNAPLKVPIDTS